MALPWLLLRIGHHNAHPGVGSLLAFWVGGVGRGIPPSTGGLPPRAGGAFTKRPDRLHGRRLELRDLQEYFTAQQEAYERAKEARREAEGKPLREAAQAAELALRAAIGADDGIEPELARLGRELEALVGEKRASEIRRRSKTVIAIAGEIQRELLAIDDEEAAFLLL